MFVSFISNFMRDARNKYIIFITLVNQEQKDIV